MCQQAAQASPPCPLHPQPTQWHPAQALSPPPTPLSPRGRALQAVRQAESGAVGWDVRAANIRGAMRLARGVVVGFGAGDFPGPRQVELLQVGR